MNLIGSHYGILPVMRISRMAGWCVSSVGAGISGHTILFKVLTVMLGAGRYAGTVGRSYLLLRRRSGRASVSDVLINGREKMIEYIE